MYRTGKLIGKIACISLMLFGCEVSNFDLQENPNYLTPESADPEYLLNEIQYRFQHFMGNMILNTDDIMRYEAMTDTYPAIVSVGVLDGSSSKEWEGYYEALNNSRTISKLAEGDETLLLHNAINKLLVGYMTITMVDYVGKIPYFQAVNPAEYPNARLDDGEDVYISVLEDIDQAILDIEASTFKFSTDLFYESDKDKWIAFAHSLKLRILVQTRLSSTSIGIVDPVAEINTLLNGNLIDTEDEDFQYTYANVVEPESRHPYFQRGYVSDFGQYMGNYFMYLLKDSKSQKDPRIRYYLYRQAAADPLIIPYNTCMDEPNVVYCYLGEYYRGLDHGESRTGYGDNKERTVYGLYPAGGAFDEDQFITASKTTTNLNGTGILPLLTTSFVKFLSAESALTLGTNGNPAELLEQAIRASMHKVMGFGNIKSPFLATEDSVDAYVEEVLIEYANATTDEERLDIIITEYYLATFGNSIEAYNAYRRTGYPSNIEVPIDDNNPTFPRSFPYSADEVEANPFIKQKKNTERVFWDTNPEGFVK